MARGDEINDRQGDLLERIADGEDLSKPDAAADRTTARALQTRGLITIAKRKGVYAASITDVGKYYLKHGYHPEGARAAGRHSYVDRTAGEELITLLRRAPDLTLRVVNPDEPTRAAYRRAVDAARQGRLVPEGQILRYTGRATGEILVRMLDADPCEPDWYRIQTTAQKAKAQKEQKKRFPMQDLRQLLTDNPAALNVSDEQRERAAQFLVDLNAAGAKHDQEVRLARRGQYARLGYRIGTDQWELSLSEEYLNSYGRPANYWEIRSSYNPAKPTGRLCLKIGRNLSMEAINTWEEKNGSPLERRIRRIVADVKARFAEAEAKTEEDHRKHVAHMAALDRKRAEERRQWESAMARAVPAAEAMLRRRTLAAALRAWRDAQDLRDICNVLDNTADNDRDPKSSANLHNWSAAGRELADRLDPTRGSAALGNIAFEIEPGADDLRPYLGGWSPEGPRQEYQRKTIDELRLTQPWPVEWELGNCLESR